MFNKCIALPIDPFANSEILLFIFLFVPNAWSIPFCKSLESKGFKFNILQRLLIVGSNREGLWLIINIVVFTGGSSRIFSNAFAPAGCRSSAESIITILRPSSVLDKWKNPLSARISSIVMDCRNFSVFGSQFLLSKCNLGSVKANVFL